MNHSLKPFKMTEPAPVNRDLLREDVKEDVERTPLESKVRETMARCKKNIRENEQEKIQQLG